MEKLSMKITWPISDSVMMAKIKGKPFDINIIQAYAPTSIL